MNMQNTLPEITPLEIVPSIKMLQERLDVSSDNLNMLTKDLEKHEDLIGKTQKKIDSKWFSSSPSKDDLFKLIKSDQKSNSESTIAIAKLFTSVNENTNDLAQMVRGLARLSCMTYEDLNNSFNEIKENRTSLNSNVEKVEKGQSQLNQIIGLHVERAKKEYEKDQLFNDSLQKIDITLKETVASVNNKIEELDASIQQVQFLKELNKKMVSDSNKNDKVQKDLKLIKILSISAFIFSVISVIYIVTQY